MIHWVQLMAEPKYIGSGILSGPHFFRFSWRLNSSILGLTSRQNHVFLGFKYHQPWVTLDSADYQTQVFSIWHNIILMSSWVQQIDKPKFIGFVISLYLYFLGLIHHPTQLILGSANYRSQVIWGLIFYQTHVVLNFSSLKKICKKNNLPYQKKKSKL